MEQKYTKNNIKTLYKSQEKVIRLFHDYCKIASEAKYKRICGEKLKKLTPDQMLQRLPKELAQLKVGNTSKNLRNISPLVVGNEVTSGNQKKFKKKKGKKNL